MVSAPASFGEGNLGVRLRRVGVDEAESSTRKKWQRAVGRERGEAALPRARRSAKSTVGGKQGLHKQSLSMAARFVRIGESEARPNAIRPALGRWWQDRLYASGVAWPSV